MLEAATCAAREPLQIGGRQYQPIAYGSERYFPPGLEARCHDCGVAPGGFHHFGCDAEQCPRCGGQLIGCDCPYTDDPEWDPAWALATLAEVRAKR